MRNWPESLTLFKMMEPEEPKPQQDQPPKKPWPLSWVLIAILAYVLFQMVYFVFFSD